MLSRLLALVFASVLLNTATAQTPAWSTDIAPILYQNCATCHRSGGIAPFELLTYQDASTYGNLIAQETADRRMPPWPPDPSYSRMSHERLLSQHDIQKIADWVSGGKPQGDPNLAPPLPVFSSTGDLPGTPDLVIRIPNYTSTAANGDVYQCFVIPSGLLNGRYVRAFEAIPGNRAVVHHVLVYADTTGVCASLDAATPGPGYTNFGGVGNDDARLVGGWVPGSAPIQFPTGFGVNLPANSDIVLQIHYPEGTAGEVDSTEVHFFFTPNSNVRPLYIDPILNHVTNINAPLFIPANQTATFTEEFTVPGVDVSLLGVAPHMHLLGKNISCWGVKPAGDTQKIIRINDWDFHWQGFYGFKRIQKISAGTTMFAQAFYDNTSANPENPSSPPQDVSAGESTTDEMMLVYFIYTLYQTGDENVVMDTTDPLLAVNPLVYYHGEQLLDVYPNPASQEVILKYYMERETTGSADVVDMQGRVVKVLMEPAKLSKGYAACRLSLGDLPSGMYQVRLRTGDRIFTRKLAVQH